ASWINHVEDSSSMSGWVFLLRKGAISWASKKKTCITSSTMESEFVALAAAGKEAEWLRNLIHEILIWPKLITPISIRCDSAPTMSRAYSQIYNGKSSHLGAKSKGMESEFVALAAAGKEAEWLRNLIHDILIWPKLITPISIRCDSAPTMAMAYSQIYNGKSSHLGVRHSMVRELIRNGVISIEFVRTQHNLADHLTKGLAGDLGSRGMRPLAGSRGSAPCGVKGKSPLLESRCPVSRRGSRRRPLLGSGGNDRSGVRGSTRPKRYIWYSK
nr:zinc finger, CCHC-type [Tanacetum cinerariifolium]